MTDVARLSLAGPLEVSEMNNIQRSGQRIKQVQGPLDHNGRSLSVQQANNECAVL